MYICISNILRLTTFILSFYFQDFTEELENQCDYVDKYENSLQELMELCLIKPHKTYTMWFDTVINKCFKWSSSEKENHFFSKQYGQDPRYFLKYNINRPFLPSILEDSEPNFCDGIRNHQTDYCIKWPCDTRTHSNFSISLLKKTGGGLTLTQMLEVNLYYIKIFIFCHETTFLILV